MSRINWLEKLPSIDIILMGVITIYLLHVCVKYYKSFMQARSGRNFFLLLISISLSGVCFVIFRSIEQYGGEEVLGGIFLWLFIIFLLLSILLIIASIVKLMILRPETRKGFLKVLLKIIIWMLIVVGLAFLMLIIDWVFSKG